MKTKEVKVSELSGSALDWCVSKCEGVPEYLLNKPWRASELLEHYSTDWEQGGPIIEREEIWLDGPHQSRQNWQAHHGKTPSYDFTKTRQTGTTPLIASMRCFVASKMGDTVSIPLELLEV
jgi:hypothetical protein